MTGGSEGGVEKGKPAHDDENGGKEDHADVRSTIVVGTSVGPGPGLGRDDCDVICSSISLILVLIISLSCSRRGLQRVHLDLHVWAFLRLAFAAPRPP